MMYSVKANLDRRNSIMKAVRKELKANNAYIDSKRLHSLAEALDTSAYYTIRVVREVEKAADVLRLADHEVAHSWAGGESLTETCTKEVFGEITFGEDYAYEYFDNGNSTGKNQFTTEGEFDVNKPFAFLMHTHDWRGWTGDNGNHDEERDTIVIYAPESIIEEKKYAAAKAAELEALCQLK